VRIDTFREGVLVFFRLYFTDPSNTAVGFGFKGVNGSGWAEENHPFTSPSYGRVFPGRIEYPFNHGCGTPSAYESDVQAWIYDNAGRRITSGTIHLACSAYFTPGTEVAVTSPQTIGPLGGIVQAPAGTPLAGVYVEFPAGALPQNSQISLAYNTGTVATNVGTHSGINIVLHSSPVTVFEQPVSITIPFASSQDIPVPYFIDDFGHLHLLQLINIDAVHNTATFQTFHASIFTWIMDRLGLGDIYTTAFRLDHDGFQVANNGSSYNRAGECLGMTTFSLWYLEDIKGSEGDFYPRFMNVVSNDYDGNPLTGQDIIATRAYISVSQQWNTYLPILTQEANLTDAQNYTIIKNGLLNTANPVIILLYHKPLASSDTAHSVLTYGYNNNGLQIYDVNFPGTTKAIGFNTGTSTFRPYAGYDGIIYNGDGTFPVTESYSSILAAAKNNFSSSANATINITSHHSGDTVTNRIVTLSGSIGSSQVLVEKLKIQVGSTEYQTNVSLDGTFSTTITVNKGTNHLQFTTQGRNADGKLIYLPNNMYVIDFTLIGDFPSSVILVTLTWDTNDTDLDLYIIDPTGDYSSYYHRTTADGGVLDFDITTGYGPEHWLLTTANTVRYGEDYTVRVHYYSDHGNGPSNYTVSVQLHDGANAITTYYRGNLAISNPSNTQPTDTGPDWANIVTLRFIAPSDLNTQSAISRGVRQEQPIIVTVPIPPLEHRIKCDGSWCSN
jgi:uncharacterized protein YfaP (DUF2135 family)